MSGALQKIAWDFWGDECAESAEQNNENDGLTTRRMSGCLCFSSVDILPGKKPYEQ